MATQSSGCGVKLSVSCTRPAFHSGAHRHETEHDALAARVRELEAALTEHQEALIWCSGSDDFQEGGKARVGWLKIAHLVEPAALAPTRRDA